METNLPPLKRSSRNFFPEPRFQFRFLGFLFLSAFVQITLTALVVGYFMNQNYEILVKYGGLEPEVQAVLKREFRMLVVVLATTFTLHLLATLAMGVFFSHRVAGAFFALKRTMKRILAGEQVELKMRQKDEFRELIDLFNEMVRALKTGNFRKSA